jgi:hypothetical protein
MIFSTPTLLRRTLFAASTLAALALAAPTQAQQTVTLSQTSGTLASCTLSGSVTVTPSGGLNITCVDGSGVTPGGGGGTTTPPVTTGALFSALGPVSITLQNGTNTATVVTRTGGTGGNHFFVYQISGTGCLAAASTVQISAANSAVNVPITPVAAGTCTMQIFATEVGDNVSGASSTITVIDNGTTNTGGGALPTGAPAIPSGCPTPAGNWKPLTLPAGGAPMQLRMTSGQVSSFPVVDPNDPALGLPSTKSEATFTQGQQPATPAGVVTEIQVSRCPGVIDPTLSSAQCYTKSSPGAVQSNGIAIILRPDPYQTPPWVDQASAAALGGCWAPTGDTNGPYFVNVRWTYNSCPYTSSGGCGFSEQWQAGPY